MTATGTVRRARGLVPVYAGVAAVFSGQQLLTPLLPALTARLGLSEVAVGVIVSSAAAIGLVLSPVWGRHCQRWGARRTLVLAVTGSGTARLGFAAAAGAGLAGLVGASACLVLLVLARGVLFGVACSAVPVAAQAYVTARTPPTQERVRGIAALGACVGIGVVAGPTLGGLAAGWGLGPALLVPAVLVLGAACCLFVTAPAADPVPETGAVSSIRPLDPRIRPALVFAFGSYLTLTASQVTLGFLVQDRLGLQAEAAAQRTGLLMVALGGGFVLTQLALVPRLGWSPPWLIRAGTITGAAAFAVLTVAATTPVLAAALAVSGTGLALASAGFMSEPTLLVPASMQGAVAGLLAAADGLAFVVGPLAATALYQLSPGAPYAASTVVLVVLASYAIVRPRPGTGDLP